MFFNVYAHEMIMQQEHQERIEAAENHRIAKSIVAWLKGQRDEDRQSWDDMRKPELTISEN